jgi:hypothetical protein
MRAQEKREDMLHVHALSASTHVEPKFWPRIRLHEHDGQFASNRWAGFFWADKNWIDSDACDSNVGLLSAESAVTHQKRYAADSCSVQSKQV